MKSIQKAFLTLACPLIIGGLASCSKEEDDVQLSKTSLLTSATWKFEAAGLDIDKDGVLDETFDADECSLDNTIVFIADGSGIFSENSIVCDGEPADPQSFAWNLKENNTIINLVVPGIINGDGNIKVLNDKKLSIYQVIEIGAGVTIHQYLQLKH